MPALQRVPSVRFEILLPASYEVPQTGEHRSVQLVEVAHALADLTQPFERFGGYTMSNPYAPPPYAGAFQRDPPERNYWLMVVVPDHLLNDAQTRVEAMIRSFQENYFQTEILAHSYSVTRYMPIE